mmetsp:Transcript_14572/g.27777  ORF Transcript_14572/g.27777 Transcript_14572/m.27777 type:complete len:509 (+) Transcript_14572:101-1627(+)
MNRKQDDEFDPPNVSRRSSDTSAMDKVPEPANTAPAPSNSAPAAAGKLGSLKVEEPDLDQKMGTSKRGSVLSPREDHPVKTDRSNDDEIDSNEKQASVAQEAAGDGTEDEKTAFPILLHEIVSDPETDDCIHWLPCGTRFIIPDKQKFANEVLPKYYGHAKFTSFTRRLKRWSFSRVPSGPFMGAYYNPEFRRGEPERAAKVKYSHPAPLSMAAIQLNKAKLQAVGAASAAGLGRFDGLEAITAVLTPQGRANLMGMNASGFLTGGMQGLLVGDNQAMLQALNNHSGVNNNLLMQVAMAQEMQRLRLQQASLAPNFLAQLARSQGSAGNGALEQKLMQSNPALAAQLFYGNQMDNFNSIDQSTRIGMLIAQQQQQQNSNINISSLLANANASSNEGQPENQNILTAMLMSQINENQQRQQGQQRQQNQVFGSNPQLRNLLASDSQHRNSFSSPNLNNNSGQQAHAQGHSGNDNSLNALLAEWVRRNPQGDNNGSKEESDDQKDDVGAT